MKLCGGSGSALCRFQGWEKKLKGIKIGIGDGCTGGKCEGERVRRWDEDGGYGKGLSKDKCVKKVRVGGDCEGGILQLTLQRQRPWDFTSWLGFWFRIC